MALCSSVSDLATLASPKISVLFHLGATPSKITHLKLNPISNPNYTSLFTQTSRIKPKSINRRNSTIRSLFTGIVEEIGQIKQLGVNDDGGVHLKIVAETVLGGVNLGDSIAVNGTCLTVTDFDTKEFSAGLAPETLRKTSLIELEAGSLVNLERAIQPIGRMGGHFVQGHVDGTGEIVSMDKEGDSLWIKVRADKSVLKYIVPKGFIAVDGTSLTVVEVFEEEGCFNFMMVAYSQQNVVIPLKKVGQKVNLEVDILGKYVERLLGSGFVESINVSQDK